MSVRFLETIGDLLPYEKVMLYGAGEGGEKFKKLIEKYRQDIEVVSFIDDFRSGEKDGLKIIVPKSLKSSKDVKYLILITSAYWREIVGKLESLDIHNFLVVNQYLLYSSQIFTNDEENRHKDSLGYTRNLLEEKEDKELFDLILDTRKIVQYTRINPYDYFIRNLDLQSKEYVDFINKERIHTLIEGGVSDGKNTIEFLDLFPKDGHIFGFEPFYEVYTKGKYRDFLEQRGNVKVYPLALWSHKDKLMFSMDDHNKDGSKIISSTESKGSVITVDTISIDDFVKENHIGRVDFIKLDIEGAELEALKGAQDTLKKCRPQLALCIYHKKEHIFEIPLFLSATIDNYVYRLGHYSSSFWDTVWYAIPREIYIKYKPRGGGMNKCTPRN